MAWPVRLEDSRKGQYRLRLDRQPAARSKGQGHRPHYRPPAAGKPRRADHERILGPAGGCFMFRFIGGDKMRSR